MTQDLPMEDNALTDFKSTCVPAMHRQRSMISFWANRQKLITSYASDIVNATFSEYIFHISKILESILYCFFCCRLQDHAGSAPWTVM